MARETVAQRNARFDTEREARLSQEVAEYPQRLMNVLARATNAYFDLSVSDNKFIVVELLNNREFWNLSYAQSPNSQERLEDLEYTLDRREAALAEEQRLREVKAEALRKVNELLTAEERELLNL
jgi:hypothetical protein